MTNVDHGPTVRQSGQTQGAGWEAVLVAAIAVAIRLVDLGFPPFVDELHHVLAAQSLVEDGNLVLHEGEFAYDRGLFFTWAVAAFFLVFGPSLEVARLPSVLSGAALVALVFLWLRLRVGRLEAWTGGLLLCFAPIVIYLSQWARFYAMHALFFWVAAFAMYEAVAADGSARRRLLVAAAGLVALILAFQLQRTTVIGLGGLILFAGLISASPVYRMLRLHPFRLPIIAGVTIALALAGAWLILSDTARSLLNLFHQVDVWALDRADNPRFYHWMFTDLYGFLWVLLPMATLIAMAARWTQALLFACVFWIGFVTHSFAAWKAERYILYLLPAFFAIWGIAAGEILPWIWNRIGKRAAELGARIPSWAWRSAAAGALVLALAFAALGVTAYTQTRQIYLTGGGDWSPPPGHLGERYRGLPDWASVQHELRGLADEAEVVIAEPDLKAIYYLGDVDFVLYRSFLMGSGRVMPEFSVWPKVGRPVISEPESIELLRHCFVTGFLVAERHAWGWVGAVPRPTADWIAENLEPVPLPERAGLVAYQWDRRSTAHAPGAEGEPQLTAGGQALGDDACDVVRSGARIRPGQLPQRGIPESAGIP